MSIRALAQHGRGYPFATNLSLISVPIGLLALLIGPEISRAFTVLFHNPVWVYGWGVVLLLGGANVAYGINKRIPSIERGGLLVLAAAYAFYGISVIVALRAGGLVTGPTFLALTVSCLQRAHLIMEAARARAALPLKEP